MKQMMRKIIVLLFAVIMCLSMHNVSFAEESSKDFEIESFDIELTVKRDNTVEVKEVLEVHFFKEESHGIYRAIPIWDQYTGEDGKTIDRRANIIDFKCEEDEYSDQSSARMFKAKIGNPDKLVPQYMTYHISYTYDLGKDPYEGRDEFIFHAFGDDLGGDVPYGKVTLKFDNREMLKDKISIWKDKYRKENLYANGKNNDTETSVATSENGIVINLSNITGSIAITTTLEDGYFYSAKDTYGIVSLLLCIIVLLISISTIVVWYFVGKDQKLKESEKVCYPPDDLDPACVSVVMGSEGIPHSKYNALAVSVASKGYISIERDPSRKNNFIIKKLIDINKPLPTNVKPLSENEKLIYESIFRGSENIVSLKENKIDEKKLQQIDKNTQEFRKKVYDRKSTRLQIGYFVLEIISLVLLILAPFAVSDMNPSLNFMYILSLIMWIVSVVFTFLLEKKTSYGEKLFGKVKSYKEFLKTLDNEECQRLLNENPQFLFEALPYTYVFGITKNWLKEINVYPDLAQFCNTAYFQNSMMFLAYHYIFINNLSNPALYHGTYGGFGGSSGVGSW